MKIRNKVFFRYVQTMREYLEGQWKYIVISLIISICFASANLISPIANRILVDRIFAMQDRQLLAKLAILMAFAFIISAVMNVLNNYLLARTAAQLNYKIKMDFFNKLQYTSIAFHISKRSGDIQYRMFYDTELLVDYFLKLVINGATYTLLIVVIVILMYRWSPILMSLVLVVFALQAGLIAAFRKPVRKAAAMKKNVEQEIIGKVNEHFNSIELVKTLGLEKYAYNDISSRMKQLIQVIIRVMFLQSMYQAGASLLNYLWSFGILLVGANLVFASNITLGTFMGFYLLAGLLYQPVVSLTGIVLSYQEVKVSYERFEEYYIHSPNNIVGSKGSKPFCFEKALEIRNVTFSYDGYTPVIKNVNLVLEPGNIVALTGRSGSGKSTFARILARLLEPQSGAIYIDGVNINAIKMDDYRKNIGFLLQTTFIIEGTLLENITLGMKEYSIAEVEKIVKQAGLEELIDTSPKRLNMYLGVRGLCISPGEAQRIGLARLLLRRPKIVILDEPTSFLDANTENIILDSLLELKRQNSLVLVISHRTSTIAIADRVLKFENGSVVDA